MPKRAIDAWGKTEDEMHHEKREMGGKQNIEPGLGRGNYSEEERGTKRRSDEWGDEKRNDDAIHDNNDNNETTATTTTITTTTITTTSPNNNDNNDNLNNCDLDTTEQQ